MVKTEDTIGSGALSMLPWTALAAGSWLVAAGMRKGTLTGGALAAAGGAMLYRAVTRPAPDHSDRRPLFVRGLMVKKSVQVASSPEECYRFWRDLENLAGFMDHLQSVRVVSSTRSRWVAKLIGGTSIEWDAEIVKDVPGEMIGWRSMSGSPLQTAGSVRFEPSGGATNVVVTFKFDPPAGRIGAALAELLGDSPSNRIGEDLNRFKKIMEKESLSGQHAEVEAAADAVDRCSEDSFPASDPPSWNPSRV